MGILKKYQATVCFRIIDLYDTGAGGLVGSVQYDDGLSGSEFHDRKIRFLSKYDRKDYEHMWTKQEIAKQKQAFWTAFGRYMKPVLSADGEVVSWLNYKTGNKYIHFKMDADSRQAFIAILVHHPFRS